MKKNIIFVLLLFSKTFASEPEIKRKVTAFGLYGTIHSLFFPEYISVNSKRETAQVIVCARNYSPNFPYQVIPRTGGIKYSSFYSILSGDTDAFEQIRNEKIIVTQVTEDQQFVAQENLKDFNPTELEKCFDVTSDSGELLQKLDSSKYDKRHLQFVQYLKRGDGILCSRFNNNDSEFVIIMNGKRNINLCKSYWSE